MKRRGRPPSFSREALIATARRLGPDGIGLQQVAAALGVSRTSLYWHVRDQDELGELVLAQIVDEVNMDDWAPGDGAAWDAWLDAYARVLRRTLLVGDGWLRYGTGRLFYSRQGLEMADHLLAVLLDAGFELEEASRAFVFVSEVVYANVHASAQAAFPREAGRDEFLRELRSLDRDHVPVLREVAKAIGRTSPEMQFEHDLAAALAGIAARAGVRSGD